MNLREDVGTLIPQPERAASAEEPRDRELPPVETLSFLGLDPNRAGNRADDELRFLREKSYGSEYYETHSAGPRWKWYALAVILILAALTYLEWPTLRSRLQSVWRPSPAVSAPAVASASAPPPPMPTAAQASPNGKAQPSTASSPTPIPVAPSTDNVVSPGNSKAGALNSAPAAPDAGGPQRGNRRGSARCAGTARGAALFGRSCVQHDSGQAAALLWKAVSKQNARADVLLADLYLRGDGVPKSCDQARLLLVAAAKKDAPGATEKLRNLESSGCR